MIDVLENFYKGNATKEELESALETWNETVEEYEENDIYVGDQYYQDALGTRDAIKEALDRFDEYYDEDGTFK